MNRKIHCDLARSDDHPPITGNSFLDTLPVKTRSRLHPHLALQTLSKGQVLAEPGIPANTVYFPVHSMISTVTQTLEGNAVEVGLTGHEGLGPVTIAFDSLVSRHLTVVQVPDSGYAIRADAFLAELAADAELRRQAFRYAEYCFAAATQFTACNGLHSLEERTLAGFS
jgi:hypothetical protein